MADNVSALPSSMQARRAQLENAGNDAPVVATPTPTPVEPAAAPAPAASDTVSEERVTISRAEFNELQAASGKAARAEGRAESLALDLEALTQRLTEVEAASKATPKAEKTPAAAKVESWEPTPVSYTEEENKDYGESKDYISKVVTEVLNSVLPKIMGRVDALEEIIGNVKTVAEGATRTIAADKTKTFTDKVKEIVGNFDECVHHKHWQDFTASRDTDTGFQWEQLVRSNLEAENVDGMVRVFNKFKEKYGVGKPSGPTGYEGAMPGGGSGAATDDIETGPKMLPFSARKEAHKKYINKEISFEEYEKIRKEYDAADAEGRVDYNK
jgi:hypothetical protein